MARRQHVTRKGAPVLHARISTVITQSELNPVGGRSQPYGREDQVLHHPTNIYTGPPVRVPFGLTDQRRKLSRLNVLRLLTSTGFRNFVRSVHSTSLPSLQNNLISPASRILPSLSVDRCGAGHRSQSGKCWGDDGSVPSYVNSMKMPSSVNQVRR